MISEHVINWFIEKSSLGEETNNHMNENYLENGFVDSLGFLELLASCEKKLGISLSDDDFNDDKIFTISGLIDLLSKKAGNKNESK